MIIQNPYAKSGTESEIENWANSKYSNFQPTQYSYATRENSWVDPKIAPLSGTVQGPDASLTSPAPTMGAVSVPTSQSVWSNAAFSAPAKATTSTIDPSKLATRTVDAKTETVAGQIDSLLSKDSPVLQQARNDALRTANERGMLNSALAASGGTDAVIRSATQIATPDAAAYGNAADYNVALKNQATMYNADQQNTTARSNAQLDAEAAARAQAFELARLQDETSRWQILQQQAGTARENNKSIANNIIQNMDLSPDRKAAMLEALGEGRQAHYENGIYVPGSGLAGAVYVIGSVATDLRFKNEPSGRTTGDTAEVVRAYEDKIQELRDRDQWGSGRLGSGDQYFP